MSEVGVKGAPTLIHSPMPITAQPGDLIFFFGTGILSNIIKLFSHGPTHSAMIIDPSSVTDDGAGEGGPYIAESSIERHIDGVQINSLPIRIRSYDRGGSIALARLDPRIRTVLDFPAMWKLLYTIVNRDRYDKLELLEYVARHVPFIEYVPQWDNPNREVCSELLAMLFAAGGLPGLEPFDSTPGTLMWMKIYSSPLEWLYGRPRNVKKFNTV